LCKFGTGCLQFNPNNLTPPYLEIDKPASFETESENKMNRNWTVAMWIKPRVLIRTSEFNGVQNVIDLGNIQLAITSYETYDGNTGITSNYTRQWLILSVPTYKGYFIQFQNSQINDDQWAHLSISHEFYPQAEDGYPNCVIVYVDAIESARFYIAQEESKNFLSLSLPYTLGRRIQPQYNDNRFRGLIDEVWMISASLNSEQVSYLIATNTNPIICSYGEYIKNNICTKCPKGSYIFSEQCIPCPRGTTSEAGSTVCTSLTTAPNFALGFSEKSNQYLVVNMSSTPKLKQISSSQNGTSSFTVAMWIYPIFSNSSMILMSKEGAFCIKLTSDLKVGVILFRYMTEHWISSDLNLNYNEWNHIVVSVENKENIKIKVAVNYQIEDETTLQNVSLQPTSWINRKANVSSIIVGSCQIAALNGTNFFEDPNVWSLDWIYFIPCSNYLNWYGQYNISRTEYYDPNNIKPMIPINMMNIY
jgi:hypothetical protein